MTPPLDTGTAPRPAEVTISTDRLRDLEQVAEAARCYEYGGRWSMAEARQKRDEALERLGLIRPYSTEHYPYTEYESTDPFMELIEQGLSPADALRQAERPR